MIEGINTKEDFERLMNETPYTIGEEIEDRAERMGSTHGYDIEGTGGVESYDKLALKQVTVVNDAMRRGQYLEPVNAAWAAEEHGWAYEPAGTVRWEVDGVPFRDTPDFIITLQNGRRVMQECKSHNAFMRDQYGAEFTDEVYDRTFVQTQFHLNTPYAYQNGLDECRVTAMFGGDKPETFVLKRDPLVGFNLFKLMSNFWNNHVLTKTAPEAKEINLYPKMKNETMLMATDEHLAKHVELENLKGLIKGYTAEKKAIEEYFRNLIGENCGIQNDAMRYTFKPPKDKVTIDYEKLIAEINPDPELIKKYTKTVPGKRTLKSVKPKAVK